MSQYLSGARKLAAGRQSLKALRQFGLRTERLRWTLALFQPCYGAGLQPRLEALGRIQQCLDDVVDYHEARRLLFSRAGPQSEPEARAAGIADAAIAGKTADLVQTLRRLETPGQQRWWTDYLTRFAR